MKKTSIALIGVLFLAACDAAVQPVQGGIGSIVVDPAITSLIMPASIRLSAIARDLHGQLIDCPRLTWSSSAQAVATVDSGGLVRTAGIGSAAITATCDKVSATASITVAQRAAPAVATVVVGPPTTYLALDGTAQLVASVRDDLGIPLAGRAVSWSSEAPGVATVDSTGRVRTHAGGSALIKATSEGKSGTAIVLAGVTAKVALRDTLLMPGQTTDVSASLFDAGGVAIPATETSWSSSDTSIATATQDGFVSTVGSGTVTISATMDGVSGAALLVVQEPPSTVTFPVVEYSPAAYPASGGKGVNVILDATAATAAASITHSSFSSPIQFRRIGSSNRFVAVITPAQVARSCSSIFSEPGNFVCLTGSISVVNGSGVSTALSGSSLRQLSPAIQPVTVTRLSLDVQRTDYVVNIRDDGLRQTGNTPRVVRRFYEFFGDAYEYLALSEIATTRGTPSYVSARNRVTGTGVGIFDNSAQYGASSSGKLRGFVNYPHHFDLAQQVASHEIAHAFCCFLANTPLGITRPHWPLSTTAFAIMGSSGNPPSNAGRYKLTPLGGDSVRVDAQSPYGGFNNLELYLMGLAAASEVDDQFVFQNQSQTVAVGRILTGATTRVTIGEIVAAFGLRPLEYTGIPVVIRIAAIVVSRGRLLTPVEMAYFDDGARRGEATVSIGGAYATPYFVNTRGRGILITRLQ